MSNIGPMIAASANIGIGYMERLLKDVPADKFARFAKVGDTVIESNHPAFIIGHLSLYACRVIEGVGDDATNYRPTTEFDKAFSHEAKCVDDVDGTIYPAMDEVSTAFFDGYKAAVESLNGASDEVFTESNPNERMQGKFPTKGAMFGFYVGGHVMMHVGQFSAWRRAVGLGPA